MEMTTIAGAVQDSGVIVVTLEERGQCEQDDGDSKEMDKGNGKNDRIQTEEKDMTINARAVKDFGDIDVTLESGEQVKAGVAEVREGTGKIPGCSIKKCHQGTQTELSAHVLIGNAGDEELVEETRL